MVHEMTKLNDNVAVLAQIKVDQARLTWFKPYLAKWPAKWAGNPPTPEMLMVPLLIDGKRPGFEAGHIAMCLRPEGCTVQQFQTAFSCGPANNYRRALVRTGWFSLSVEGKPYAFKLTVTAKGEAKLVKAMAAAAEAATNEQADKPAKPAKKPARKRAAKKAVTQPAAQTPTSEPASPNEGQADTQGVAANEPVAGEALAQLAAHFNQA